ncbi:MAG TPA: glycosyltransferase family 2 protein [Chloroflexi bacterium]|nr:glycosyltransferase family 2 protein [Chloroflexota bacterium]
MALPPVSIVILNWNGLEDTAACLASLAAVDYPALEVVVVDNGSTDGSPTILQQRFPGLILLETGENLGYAGGNNVGLRYALERGAEYVLLLNNDTEVAPDFLRRMVEVAEADERVGAVGPMIYYHSRPDVIWSAGGAIDWRRGRTRMVGVDEPDRGQFGTAPREVDFVTGCAMLVRREATERAGLLDERFFLYYEEVEWCVRIRRAGFRILHVPTARVWHKIPFDGREASPMVHYYMTRNRLLFLKLTGAGWLAWTHTLLMEYVRRFLSWSIRPKWWGKQAQRRALWQGVIDYFQGRWGRMEWRRTAGRHSTLQQ